MTFADSQRHPDSPRQEHRRFDRRPRSRELQPIDLIPSACFPPDVPFKRTLFFIVGSSREPYLFSWRDHAGSAGNKFMRSTMPNPTSATMDWITDIVLVASPIVMPKDSFTSQKPA